MYLDSGNGYVEVANIKCYLPKKPAKYHFINYGLKKKDQKWTRQVLPDFSPGDIQIWDGTDYEANEKISWEEAVRQETIKRTGCDPWDLDKSNNPRKVNGITPDYEFIEESIEAVRQRELDRIHNGCWVYINGKEIYLTGPHYMYLNYWQLDRGYPNFRWTDVEFFYMVEVARHPDSPHAGLLYITRRGSGKSFKTGLLLYYSAITRRKAHCGIQSKDDDSAEELFRTKILQPYVTLPEFLIPHNPYIGDVSQLKKLDFVPPAKKNIDARVYNKIKKEALYSKIDYRPSREFAYDGSTLACLVNDEIGKTLPSIADVEKRWGVNKFCIFRGPVKMGYAVLTSTIESESEGGAQAYSIWRKSDPGKIKNGTTATGLLRLLCSANDDFFFDEYGFSEVDKANAYHEAELDKISDDPVAVVSYKQKNPRNEQEAFWFTGHKCIYNAEILHTAKERCLENPQTVRGDLFWKEKDKEVGWIPNALNGKWYLSHVIEDSNLVQINSGSRTTFTPNAAHKRVIGFDPFAVADVSDENKGSDAAIVVYQKYDFHTPEDHCNTFIATYCNRPATPEDAYEDCLMAAFFFGAKILVETNKGNFLYYSKLRGYKWGYDNNENDFMLSRPESTLKPNQNATEGIYMTAGIIEQYTDLTAEHIRNNGYKLKHVELIDDFLNYNPKKTKKYDLAVAAGLALLGAEAKIDVQLETIELTDIFKTFNNTGTYSEING